jgi:hypothetical protein
LTGSRSYSPLLQLSGYEKASLPLLKSRTLYLCELNTDSSAISFSSAHCSFPRRFSVQCDPLTYCGTLAAAGYCPKYLSNLALPASERMNQTFDLEAWKVRMTTCVQVLEGSSVPGDFEVWKLLDYSSVSGCPLPRRTKSREGVLNRPKGTKRDQPDAAAGGKVPTATYRHKRRCVNQAAGGHLVGVHVL